jgi:hypothetical protein
MKLIDLPTPPAKPLAQQIADSELMRLNASLETRITDHRAAFSRFWDSPITPDALLEAMGPAALIYLQAASESAAHIARLAGIVGKSLDDALPPQFYQPRREFIIDPKTGRVALAPPAEGHDAWGRLIPPPVDPSDRPPGFPGLPPAP